MPTKNASAPSETTKRMPHEDDIVKIKIKVNVWDHNSNKLLKDTIVTLQRKQADQLLAEGKAVRIDPIPAEE
ncbi:MAG: hypothetical protein AAF621_00520 [Pseudomonadota bacterium]